MYIEQFIIILLLLSIETSIKGIEIKCINEIPANYNDRIEVLRICKWTINNIDYSDSYDRAKIDCSIVNPTYKLMSITMNATTDGTVTKLKQYMSFCLKNKNIWQDNDKNNENLNLFYYSIKSYEFKFEKSNLTHAYFLCGAIKPLNGYISNLGSLNRPCLTFQNASEQLIIEFTNETHVGSSDEDENYLSSTQSLETITSSTTVPDETTEHPGNTVSDLVTHSTYYSTTTTFSSEEFTMSTSMNSERETLTVDSYSSNISKTSTALDNSNSNLNTSSTTASSSTTTETKFEPMDQITTNNEYIIVNNRTPSWSNWYTVSCVLYRQRRINATIIETKVEVITFLKLCDHLNVDFSRNGYLEDYNKIGNILTNEVKESMNKSLSKLNEKYANTELAASSFGFIGIIGISIIYGLALFSDCFKLCIFIKNKMK